MREIETPGALLQEAQWLWAAETNNVPHTSDDLPPRELSRDWGRVAIVMRPDKNVPGEILKALSDRLSDRDDDSLLVDSKGVLNIPWPNGAEARRFDLLLATTNRPTERDPSARNVAYAWNAYPEERYYFEKNQRACILTFQDVQIKRFLRIV